jgi:hypothetical protein
MARLTERTRKENSKSTMAKGPPPMAAHQTTPA